MHFLGDHVAYAFVVVVVALAGIIVLAVLHDPIPDVLSGIALGLTVGGAALAHPSSGSSK